MTAAVPLLQFDREYSLRRHETLLLLAVGAAAAADWLFWDAPVGCSLAVFNVGVLLVMLATGGTRRPHTSRRASARFVIAMAILGLCLSFVEEPSLLSVALCAVGLICLALQQHHLLGRTPAQWGRHIAGFIATSPLHILLDRATVARWAWRHPSFSGVGGARSILRWTAPVLLSALFLGLFSLANPVVEKAIAQAWAAAEHWLERIFDWMQLLDVIRVFFWIIVAAGMYALLRPRSPRRPGRGGGRRARAITRGYAAYMAAQPPPLPAAQVSARVTTYPPNYLGLIVRCLLAFNVVFAIENALDAAYLFAHVSLPNGMTYAEYAHRGSYPLVAAALLAGAFILLAFRPAGAAQRSTAARWLVFAWLAQTVLLTCSAIWRLDLYVDAYSLSQLRLAAGIWMLLVVAGLVWIFARILLHRSNTWLLTANVFTTLAVLYLCGFLNTGGFVADYNVAHCREVAGSGPSIDINYLRQLGPEALPALKRLAPYLDPKAADNANSTMDRLHEQLLKAKSDWRGWTYRRYRLSKVNS